MKRLLRAIEDKDSVVAKQLLKADPPLATMAVTVDHYYAGDINHRLAVDDTALHLAAAGYRCEIVRALLGAGADVNANANWRNNASLHYAAEGYINVTTWDEPAQRATIDCLLEHGADINIQDKNGATPLHKAVRTRCAGAVQLLLQRGARPDVQNKPGSTPFHLAVQNTGRGGTGDRVATDAQAEIIRTFVCRGVSVDLLSGNGKTVLETARSPTIRALLET